MRLPQKPNSEKKQMANEIQLIDERMHSILKESQRKTEEIEEGLKIIAESSLRPHEVEKKLLELHKRTIEKYKSSLITQLNSLMDISHWTRISPLLLKRLSEEFPRGSFEEISNEYGQERNSVWKTDNVYQMGSRKRERERRGISFEELYPCAESLFWKMLKDKGQPLLPSNARLGKSLIKCKFSFHPLNTDNNGIVWSKPTNHYPASLWYNLRKMPPEESEKALRTHYKFNHVDLNEWSFLVSDSEEYANESNSIGEYHIKREGNEEFKFWVSYHGVLDNRYPDDPVNNGRINDLKRNLDYLNKIKEMGLDPFIIYHTATDCNVTNERVCESLRRATCDRKCLGKRDNLIERVKGLAK